MVRAAGLVLVASSVFFVPSGANASGGYTLACSGSSPVPVVPNSSVGCAKAGTPSDDDGAYLFTYSPALVCGPPGTSSVTAAGGEMQLGPASASYSTLGGIMRVTFTYTALEKSIPPAVETHKVALDIDCSTGLTTGSLSE